MRVLEVGDSAESAKAARVVGQLGSDVIKVENIAQTQSLRTAFSAEGNALLHLALDPGKQSVALDFSHAEAGEVLRRLLEGCDGAIVAHGEGKALWEGCAAGKAGTPALVFDAPAPFYDGYARSGHMVAYGDAAREPLAGPPQLPALFAGVSGLIAFYAAVLAGSGEAHVETTRTMAALYPKSVADVSYRGIDVVRGGRAPRGYHPAANYICADGFVSLLPLSDEKSLALLRLAGRADAASDERFQTNAGRLANHAAYDELLAPWMSRSTRDEIVQACQAEGIPSGAIQTVSDYLEDRQPAARGFFASGEAEDGRRYRLASLPDGQGSAGRRVERVAAPGEHTRDVLREVGGLSEAEIADLLARGVAA